jgi:cytochrome c oxidase subunit 2
MNEPGNIIFWGAVVPVAAVCFAIFVLLVRTALRREAHADPAPDIPPAEPLRAKAWIVLGIAAVAIISVPAQRLISLASGPPTADISVEVTGNMWFWTYRYLDQGEYSFSAPMLEDAITGERRLAGLPESDTDEDNRIVVPVGKTVRLVTKGDNVIYRWGNPAIGASVDALPGRPNETWFTASSQGRYYSDYEALCSPSHVFIPIEIEVVSEEQYDRWRAEKQTIVGAADARSSIQ